MNRLVGDLLLLARADAGRVGSRVECDLAMIAAEALEEVAPVSDGHVFAAELHDSAPVAGNPDELHRMVLNLLENAIRHTPEGTEVEVDLAERDGEALLTVSDDGPGLPDGHGDPGLRPLRPRRGPGRPQLPERHRHRARPLDRPRRRRRPRRHRQGRQRREAGGACFEVRLPLDTSTEV